MIQEAYLSLNEIELNKLYKVLNDLEAIIGSAHDEARILEAGQYERTRDLIHKLFNQQQNERRRANESAKYVRGSSDIVYNGEARKNWARYDEENPSKKY